MYKPKRKAFMVSANMFVMMTAMCIGAACHAVWQRKDLSISRSEADDGTAVKQNCSNNFVRVSIPWGCAEFDYPDVDACEQQLSDEEFMESLLAACGFEYQPGYEMRECRCYMVKGLESSVLLQSGIVRCKGWPGGTIPDDRLQIAKETVERLNASAPRNVRLCMDCDLLWCESVLPIEVLRRIASLDEQREALMLLSKIPNDAIKSCMPEIEGFLSRGE